MRALVALILGVAVSLAGVGLAAAERRQEKFRASLVEATRVDMGVALVVVRKDPRNGDELIPGLPRMKQIGRPVHLGGMVAIDANGARYVGRSAQPVVWHASEQQAELILHDGAARWQLIEGSEGSNKTTTLVRWIAARILENVGRKVEIGLTGPVGPRMQTVKEEIEKWWSPSWWSFSERYQLYRFHAGPRVRMVSGHQRGKKSGSSIQSYNWIACASDEMQDHSDREADILARGRTASASARGVYLRICTSTPKDDAAWRDYRAAVQATPKDGAPSMWRYARMLGMESPFVSDDYWLSLRASGTYTERDWQRRVLAMDVGPEKQVYFNWRRTFENGEAANLAPIPRGAVDVTARELRTWGRNVVVLAGHDPGLRQHVTVFLKAYEMPRDKAPRWFVVGEVTSPEATIHGHIQEVKAAVARRWNAVPEPDRFGDIDPNAPTMLVRIDPATQSGEEHPGEDVFRAWRVAGLQAKPAAYAPGSSKGTPLKKRQRIDLINTLLAATAAVGEVRRLFVALVDGKAAAPMLVKAFETMETNEAGKAEAERKDANDLSHWPAATAFALWLIESRRLKWEPEEAAA